MSNNSDKYFCDWIENVGLVSSYGECRKAFEAGFLAGECSKQNNLIDLSGELLAAAEKVLAECYDLISTPAGDALGNAIAKAKGEK